MAAAARGATARSPFLLHHHHRCLPQVPAGGGGSLRAGWIGAGRERGRRVRVGVRVFTRYSSQAQDFSTRLQDRADELPRLVEDLLRTSISTGPRGAFRMAQGIQAVLGVGGEWLNDFSKEMDTEIIVATARSLQQVGEEASRLPSLLSRRRIGG